MPRKTSVDIAKMRREGRVVSEFGGRAPRPREARTAPSPPKPEPLPPLSGDHLSLWFPGLELASWNRLMGSKKQSHQFAAKRRSQDAVANLPEGSLFSVPAPVAVNVVVAHKSRARIRDLGNVCEKYLIDAIVAAGVIPDDDWHTLQRLTFSHEISTTGDVGTRVIITPIGGAQ